MNRVQAQTGVLPFRTGRVRGVLDREKAEEYLGIERARFWKLRESGSVPFVKAPRCRAGNLFRVVDLDRYLAEETDLRWRPRERIGEERELGTRQAAYYLHLSRSQVRRLARFGKIPHEGGGQGIPYRFQVAELNACLAEWLIT